MSITKRIRKAKYISNGKFDELIMDEQQGIKEYKKLESKNKIFKGIKNDEKKHLKILKDLKHKASYMTLFILLISSFSVLTLADTNQLSTDYTSPPKCNPLGLIGSITFGVCKWFNYQIPEYTNFIKKSIEIDQQNQQYIIERQREHYAILSEMKKGTITPIQFATLNQDIIGEYNTKIMQISIDINLNNTVSVDTTTLINNYNTAIKPELEHVNIRDGTINGIPILIPQTIKG